MKPVPSWPSLPPGGVPIMQPRRRAPSQIALWGLMGVIGMLFSLMLVAYVMRMSQGDWRPLPPVNALWVNTGVLAAACIVMQSSASQARHGELRRSRRDWALAGVLAIAFVAGQLWVWRDLTVREVGADGTERVVPAERPATVRHLMMHMAGIGYARGNLDLDLQSVGGYHSLEEMADARVKIT